MLGWRQGCRREAEEAVPGGSRGGRQLRPPTGLSRSDCVGQPWRSLRVAVITAIEAADNATASRSSGSGDSHNPL